MNNKFLFIILFSFILLFSIIFFTNTDSSKESIDSLSTVRSYTHFKTMIRDIHRENNRHSSFGFFHPIRDKMSAATTATLNNMDEALTDMGGGDVKSSSDYSKTNVQVEGVDEADIIKTDGSYIYQIKNSSLIISKVNPSNDMSVIYNENFDSTFYPSDLYVDEKHLVLIGSDTSQNQDDFFYDSYSYSHSSIMKVFQLNDRYNMELMREIETDGSLVSSRKIGDSIYLISNKKIPTYLITNNERNESFSENDLKPSYRDSLLSEEENYIDWDQIQYFPDFKDENFLIVTGFNLSVPNQPVSVSSFLGSGDTIYSSTEHLYVAKSNYEYSRFNDNGWGSFDMNDRKTVTNTSIFKFNIHDGKVSFAAEGKVDGTPLNQFSMDEHNNHFRIATTTGEVWNTVHLSKNHLFILDENLEVVGKINDIAPGEKIYSVRFMGDRGYMVTFKKVDPLFVFDLSEPKNPNILGKLKIPGYSDYLHPYDENHIIGFGKDTVEAKEGDFAYYQGLKMALFDITDVNNPKEKFKVNIGDRGTDSPLLQNHKALLFSKEKNILAFPVNLHEIPEGSENAEGNTYGVPTFQGAFIYGIDLKKGFVLKNMITHNSKEDELKSGYYYDNDNSIHRILYIDNSLYTVSNSKIMAHNLHNFSKEGEVFLPK